MGCINQQTELTPAAFSDRPILQWLNVPNFCTARPPWPRLDEASRQAADLPSFVLEMRHVALEGPTFQDGSDVADV